MAFEKKIDGKTLYEGVIVNVRLDRAELVNGDVVRREVVEHPGGVTVIPVEEDGTVWCVRQFRYPFQREMLEVPAGKLEIGEKPLPAAVRELSEETGLEAGRMIYLGACCTSPGFSTEVLHIYLALELKHGDAHPDEDEFLNVEKHSLETLTEMVMSGEIDDAKTIIAVLKARRFLEAEGWREKY
ncbi:MAG TPA: NUDIX hydrolase [Candidatus Scatomorpha pullicola]|nr:NUDIX hydrolase [Candidatus Scatomorpha pullicola]